MKHNEDIVMKGQDINKRTILFNQAAHITDINFRFMGDIVKIQIVCGIYKTNYPIL